jgi:hypothetical protein
MQFGFLQTTSNLTTTTLLQILFNSNPPKFIQKFKNIFLAGIISNTLQAEKRNVPMLAKMEDQVLPCHPLAPL